MSETTIRMGSRGTAVSKAQQILNSLNMFDVNSNSNIDGVFGRATEMATRRFQRVTGLGVDGVVGPLTWGRLVDYDPSVPYPVKPSYGVLSYGDKVRLFGDLDYQPRTGSKAGQGITVSDVWKRNLVTVSIPELKGIPLYSLTNSTRSSGNVTLHKLAGQKFQEFFKRVREAGLLHLILTYDGGYNPRFIRSSKTVVSSHAFGTAIDINGFANGLGKEPARPGAVGCVYDLIPIANALGIYWGGHFSNKDGMHLEIARL